MRPRVYIGDTRKQSFLLELERLGWGVVVIDRMSKSLYERPFFLDNGAYIAWKNDTPWDSDKFMKMVDKIHDSEVTPDFVVLPDRVGAGSLSLDLSLSWIDKLPADWPKALASQDGMTHQELESAMEYVDVWFLGGTNAHKLHASDYCEQAHRLGKRFHFARCSTLERLDWAMHIGVDSLDSSFPLWTKERFRQFVDVWENGHPQGELIAR
jgi:hypothetical protein